MTTPYLSFGVGFGIGFLAGFGWGWGHWGFDWHNRYPIYDHNRYYSHTNTFYNRDNYYRGGGERGMATNVEHGVSGSPGGYAERAGGVYNRPGATTHPFGGNAQAARGYAEPRGESGDRSGAFSNYDHGGEARSFSSRGGASFGGSGGLHGGGGFHGGGGSHGGRH